MDKLKVRKYLRLAIIVVLSMMAGSVITILIKNDGNVISKKAYKTKGDYSEFKSLYEAYDTIMNGYYKEVDSKTLIDGATKGMLDSLEDQHTSYFNEEQTDDFNTELSEVSFPDDLSIFLSFI